MKTRFLALGASLLVLSVGSVLLAGSDNRKGGKDEDKGAATPFRASQLMGLSVRPNNSKDNIAHVEDLVINLNNGRLVYYAVGYGQVIGFGGKLVAVAPEAMRVYAASNNRPQYFALNMTKGDLENAKTFDSNHWPQYPAVGGHKGGATKEGTSLRENVKQTAKEVKEAVREGTERLKEQAGGKGMERRMTRISALTGISVRNPKGDNLGSTFDFVVDTAGNRVVYAAVSHGGTAGFGGKLYAVPWRALELKSLDLRPGSRVFVINATNEEFNNATGFTSVGGDRWPGEPSPAFKAARPKS
jgi:sporulation protein YlmC with PRC-barrel domain